MVCFHPLTFGSALRGRTIKGGTADVALLGKLQGCGTGTLHVTQSHEAGDVGETPPFTNNFVYLLPLHT
jgi:hypothetical protein